mgnify:CR=1 FL=1|jgi:hypothetical protein
MQKSLPKALWEAHEYAVSFCTKLRGIKLRRRLHKFKGAKWATFYRGDTLKKVWSCNAVFAAKHFSRTGKAE